ncbi:FAD-binding domain-containing protein, partial [Psychromonas aquatilis]
LKSLFDKFPYILISSDSDEFTLLIEIIWREFYSHLLFDQPRLSNSYCFNDIYHGVKWHYDENLFTAWCEG